jgi:hypothetical protein
MRFKTTVIVAGTGAYDIEGKVYPWADLLDLGGELGVVRATLANGYTPNGELGTGVTAVADLELHKREDDKRIKFRLHGAEAVKTTAKSA